MSDLSDSIKAKGSLVITKVDGEGKVQEYSYPNLVVNVGKDHIASRLNSNTALIMRAIAIGTGTTAPDSSQTGLIGTELARQATTVVGGTVTGNAILYTATFAAGTGTGAISEAGIFNNTTISGVGTMLCRTKFDVVNKGAADSITINWTVQIT